MDAAILFALITACAPLIDPTTARAVVEVESAGNPLAIGVVGGLLERQPRHHAEAMATARALRANGWSFSVGLAQINSRNFAKLGLALDDAFDPCTNLHAMQTVLLGCHERALASGADAQPALRRALSCYYSGNFKTGFDHGYVSRAGRTVASVIGPVTQRKEQ